MKANKVKCIECSHLSPEWCNIFRRIVSNPEHPRRCKKYDWNGIIWLPEVTQ